MLKQETMIKLRDRGAVVATTAGMLFAGAGSASAVAPECVKYLDANGAPLPQTSVPDYDSVQAGLCSSVSGGNQKDIFADGGLFQKVVNALLFLVGAISVIMLIIGGIRYIVSAGDQNAVTGAKNTIMYAIIGIIVAVLAFGIVNFVLGRLN